MLAHLAMDSTSSTDKDSSAAKNEAAARVTPEVDPLELIKAGVRLDTTSFICWQVLGLYHRLKRNFAETLRCYKTALRFEPHQPTILRDSALLQAHERQFAALVESRNMLLRINASEGGAANAGQMWRALSIAYAMAGQPEAALRALEASFATKEQQQDTHCAPGTRSELMRFKWKLEALAGHPTTARVTDNVNIEDAPIADADLQDEAVALYSPDETLRALACSRRLERNPDLPVSSALVEHQNAVVGHTSDVLALGRKLEVAVKTGNIESFGLVFTSLLNEGLLERAPISLFKLVTIAAFDQKPSHIDVRTIHQTISNLLSERQSSLATVIFQALLLDAIGNSIEALGLISSAIGPHHPKGVVAEGDTQVSVDNDTVNAIAPATENIHLLVDAFTVRAKIHKVFYFVNASTWDCIVQQQMMLSRLQSLLVAIVRSRYLQFGICFVQTKSPRWSISIFQFFSRSLWKKSANFKWHGISFVQARHFGAWDAPMRLSRHGPLSHCPSLALRLLMMFLIFMAMRFADAPLWGTWNCSRQRRLPKPLYSTNIPPGSVQHATCCMLQLCPLTKTPLEMP